MTALLRWSRSATRLVAVNALVLAASLGAGWAVGTASAGANGGNVFQHTAGESQDALTDVTIILEGNLRVIATLLLGACTLGLLSVAAVAWNGFGLGVGLAVLARESPEVVYLLLRYLPFEFSAFVLASAASMSLSRWIVMVLGAIDGATLRPAASLLASSLTLIALAAVIEAGVKHALAGR